MTLDERIYGGVEKIFPLFNDPPIAIMIYNSSDFSGIPLENLISEYIKKTDFNIINTVSKVKDDFLNYIHCTVKKEEIDDFINLKLIEFKKELTNLNDEAIDYYSTTEVKNEILPIYEKYSFNFKNEVPPHLSRKKRIIPKKHE